MVSPHLEAERDRLLQLIQTLRDSDSGAPINVWSSPAPKGEHIYYKLSSKNTGFKNQHLGKAVSEKYRNWRARIQRRKAIARINRLYFEKQCDLIVDYLGLPLNSETRFPFTPKAVAKATSPSINKWQSGYC
ncbi:MULTISPECIES: hypothetical protein [Trichocoleus]|uniref:Uncharacterized protein n=1 Tax=Trichocoleus desertorum GB2-A4 TaxID=2933944 RepID=A0ABV0JHC7_9CYAN|nr:hypothetical protein [Trichocoleus sp. FACHB-46]